jgi:hypothetical protein
MVYIFLSGLRSANVFQGLGYQKAGRLEPGHASSTKGEPKMKIVLIVGIMWVGICLVILWLNHRFPRHHVSKSDRQDLTPQVSVKTQSRKSVTHLTSKDDMKIVSTNISLSPKTGKITSQSGEVEIESYQRPKPAKTIEKIPPDRDVGQE